MEIDCPEQAVAIWVRGDHFQIRFPDRQLIEIPLTEAGRLVNLLKMREKVAKTTKDWRISQVGSTTQWDVDDCRRESADRQFAETARQRSERRKAEADKKLKNKIKRRVELEEAEALLASAGL